METDIIRKFVVNFLVYNKKYTIKEAVHIFDKNSYHFKCVFEILGEDLLDNIGRNIDGSKM